MARNARYLRIVHYPAPSLRLRAEPVERIDEHVGQVAGRMIELMGEAEGIGLAAPQVGLSWRLFVAHVPPPHRLDDFDNADEADLGSDDGRAWTDEPIVCVNPVITSLEGPAEPSEEGCLSLPDIRGDVLRPPVATLEATDLQGKAFSIRCQGLLARCVQHELDHLDGVLIIDKMTQLSRLKNRAALRDLERQAQALR